MNTAVTLERFKCWTGDKFFGEPTQYHPEKFGVKKHRINYSREYQYVYFQINDVAFVS